MNAPWLVPMTRWMALSLTAVTFSLAAACGGAATPTRTEAPEGGINPILATTVLRVGTQRVAFLLTTKESLVSAPHATVRGAFLGDERVTTETKEATFHLWPYGVRGAYSTDLAFDRPGRWRLDISVDIAEGGEVGGQTQLVVDVAEQVDIPEIGTLAPLSRNKTLDSVGTVQELTSDFTPDPDLYQLTIAEAIGTAMPTVVVFATPAFCSSPTCGPQVDTVSELKDRHRGTANFIHVEIYDNPEDIQGDLDTAALSPIVQEWGLTTLPGWFNESWTFVLGPDGRVIQRFEGFATLEELEAVLTTALAQG